MAMHLMASLEFLLEEIDIVGARKWRQVTFWNPEQVLLGSIAITVTSTQQNILI